MALALVVMATAANAASATGTNVARGKYLVNVIGCTDCHTADTLFGHPDIKHFLGGSNLGFPIPGLGVFYPSNLTPDKETGLGKWTKSDIVKAMRTGQTPDGRILAPIMPYADLANLTDADAYAMAAYLKSLPAIHNKVPGPFGPTEKPVGFVMPILPAEVFAKFPPPPSPPQP